MDPFESDRHKRRRKHPFDVSEDELNWIYNEMHRLFEKRAFRQWIKLMLQKSFESNEQRILKFNINIVPIRKSTIQRSSNSPLKKLQEEPRGYRDHEPLPDILEGDNEVFITVAIPGVEKEDINLTIVEDMLEITIDTSKMDYHEVVNLPCEVKPETVESTYKNGVLDVTIKKK
jgi:HSP20 family molecular chaperone IbpA